jgi:alginate O-acetyltransferase complex protein AlgI
MFGSVGFWAAVIGAAAISAGLPRESVRARAALLVALSLAVLHVGVGLSLSALGVALLAAAWVIVSLRATKSLAAALLPIAALWIAGKLTGVLSVPKLGLLAFVGFSFFFVKAWTLIKDVRDERIQDPDPFVVLAYFFFFPTWVSGPMHLFAEFDESFRAPKMPDKEGFADAIFRVALGLFKVNILVPMVSPLGLGSLLDGHHVRPHATLVAAFAYSFVILLDFSGYSDLAIAASRLAGYKTPENFERPYLAPNIREFWQRWHITFSRVLTSYAFVPLSRALSGPLKDRQRPIMVVAYLGTFLFCGYWHGPTANFLLWGVYHAIGLVVYDIYRTWAMKKRRARKGKPFLPAPWGKILSTAFTFAFVSVGWIFFALPLHTILGR